MPAATDTFQQIAGSGPGPFTQFLRPHVPLDYGTQQGGPQSATGYEDTVTGEGKLALGFLQGVRQRRLEQAQQDDANVQAGLDNFQRHVAQMMADPDLTDAGKQAIGEQANQIMNQHMHYEMRDVPKDGVAGFFKNLLTHASGGPIKTRDPINWDQATGQITNARRPEHSQRTNYQRLLAEGYQDVENMKRDLAAKDILPGAEDFKGALHKTYMKMQAEAPSYAKDFWDAASMGGLPVGGAGYPFRKFTTPVLPAASPRTDAPPQPMAAFTPAAGYSAAPSFSPVAGFSTDSEYPRPAPQQSPAAQPVAGAAPQPGALAVGQTVRTPDGREVQVRHTGVELPQF